MLHQLSNVEVGYQFSSSNAKIDSRIRVIGVGRGGINAVTNMIASNLQGVAFIATDTDAQSLGEFLAEYKIQLGSTQMRGLLDAEANPQVGQQAALKNIDQIKAAISGSDILFIVTSMGGNTGTGAAPVIAQAAKEQGILTVGMVTSPFSFEGKKRLESAEAGIEEFRKHVDSLIIIPNDRLLQVAPQKSTSTEALKKADEILYFAVKGISDLLLRPSLVTLDIHDVRSVMSFSGCLAVMGTGFASGESRAREAAIKAVANAELLLPEGVPFGGARRVLMNITCGPDLGIDEVAEAASIVAEATHEDSQLIFAPLCDENIGDAIRITFIATGFD